MRRRIVNSLSVVITFGLATVAIGSASAASAATPGWTDTTRLANRIEEQGVAVRGVKQPVDMTVCSGLRRYGHREFGVSTGFHRFNCSVDTANGHSYVVGVTITRSVLSLKPVAGEPRALTANLLNRQKDLADAQASIDSLGKSGAQQKGIAEYLRPFRERVAEAKALLEPYRTRFWMTFTSSEEIG